MCEELREEVADPEFVMGVAHERVWMCASDAEMVCTRGRLCSKTVDLQSWPPNTAATRARRRVGAASHWRELSYLHSL